MNESPYITTYAEDHGMSLEAATEDILLRWRLDDEYLQKNERARMKIFRAIREAKDVRRVREALEEMRHLGI
jgi:hypothetical protein